MDQIPSPDHTDDLAGLKDRENIHILPLEEGDRIPNGSVRSDGRSLLIEKVRHSRGRYPLDLLFEGGGKFKRDP